MSLRKTRTRKKPSLVPPPRLICILTLALAAPMCHAQINTPQYGSSGLNNDEMWKKSSTESPNSFQFTTMQAGQDVKKEDLNKEALAAAAVLIKEMKPEIKVNYTSSISSGVAWTLVATMTICGVIVFIHLRYRYRIQIFRAGGNPGNNAGPALVQVSSTNQAVQTSPAASATSSESMSLGNVYNSTFDDSNDRTWGPRSTKTTIRQQETLDVSSSSNSSTSSNLRLSAEKTIATEPSQDFIFRDDSRSPSFKTCRSKSTPSTPSTGTKPKMTPSILKDSGFGADSVNTTAVKSVASTPLTGNRITLDNLQKSLERMEKMKHGEFKGLDQKFKSRNLRKIFYDKEKDTPATSKGFLYRKNWSPEHLDKIGFTDDTIEDVPTTPIVVCTHVPKCESKEECQKCTEEDKTSDDQPDQY